MILGLIKFSDYLCHKQFMSYLVAPSLQVEPLATGQPHSPDVGQWVDSVSARSPPRILHWGWISKPGLVGN